MSTTGTLNHRLTATGTNRTDVQVSKNVWNDTLIVSGGAIGGLMIRDSGKTDGWGLIDAVAVGQVLGSAGVATEPAWTASPVLTAVKTAQGGLRVLDTNDSHYMKVACGSNITADRTVTITPGDSDRTVTLSGNPTLADWFDQAVKVASSPTFAAITIGSTAFSEAELGVLDSVTPGTASASKAVVLDANKDIGTIRNLTLSGTFNATGVGPHAIGGATSSLYQLRLLGSFAGADGCAGLLVSTSLSLSADARGNGLYVAPTFVEAGSGTHSLLASVRIDAATVTAGAAAVTDTASLYIANAMSATVTGQNYSLLVADGKTRIDGLVALGSVTDANTQLSVAGTFNPTGGATESALSVSSTINAIANDNVNLVGIQGTITEAGSGTHAKLMGLAIYAPTITAGAATVTNTASLYISDAPTATVTGANYALWVDSGATRLDGSLTVGSSLILDGTLSNTGAGVITTDRPWSWGANYLSGSEMTAPSAPAANGFRIFAQDNGGGKTQLMVIFGSGAAQQIAIEP